MTTTTNDAIIELLKGNKAIDNVMIDDGFDTYFRSVHELDDPIESGSTITPLETLASFDHGLRTADETSAFIPLHELQRMDLWSMMCAEVLDGTDWTGGWIDVDEDSDDLGSWVYEWSQEMASAASAAGLIVESDGDAGMTWIFQPHQTIEV